MQSVQDMEDRILRDSHKTQQLANGLKKRTDDYSQILGEYERLQTQEQDLLRQMFNLQGQSGVHTNHFNDHDRNQLEVLQRENARLEKERRSKILVCRSIAFTLIILLVIQNRLEELIASDYQPTNVSHYEPYRLLRDMKEEQDKNEKALVYLRRRLVYPNRYLNLVNDLFLSFFDRLSVICYLCHISILFDKQLLKMFGRISRWIKSVSFSVDYFKGL